MLRRIVPIIAAVLLACAAIAVPATASGPTANATSVKAKAAKAAKSCKKATARAAKAKTPAKAKKLKQAKKKACKKAKKLAAQARASEPAAKSAPAAAKPEGPKYQPKAPGEGFVVGIDANTKAYADPGAQMDRISQAHVTQLREELEWGVVEPAKGAYDWSRYDRVYYEAAERGIEILAGITSPPSWAEPDWNWIPDNPAEYSKFVAKVAARYGPGGSFWASHPELEDHGSSHFELWNEPYVAYFAGNGMSAGRYANLAIAAADAGRAANPRTNYLASADNQDNNGEDWTRAMFTARPDLADHVDGFAVHPYGPDLDTYNEGPAGSFRRNLEETGTALVENGAAAKPMWITELGWSTCNSGGVCVSEQRQAQLTKQLGELLRTTYSSSVRGLFLFNYSDHSDSPSESEANYGYVRENGTPKPALTELRSIADSQN